jgi:hypothetical protein
VAADVLETEDIYFLIMKKIPGVSFKKNEEAPQEEEREVVNQSEKE